MAVPPFPVRLFTNSHRGFGFLRERGIPIVIAEKDAPGGGWKTILHEIQQYTPVPKLIVTYRFSEARSAVEMYFANNHRGVKHVSNMQCCPEFHQLLQPF